MSGLPVPAFVLSACTIALACVSTARADSALVLPHAGDPALLALRESAQRGLQNALRDAGFDLRTQAKTSGTSKRASELAACEQIDCAPSVLSHLGADIAVALAVWQGAQGAEVNVTIVDATGTRFPGRAVIGADAAHAAQVAVLEAQGLRMLGPGPWVSVGGDPAGASVWIDGRFVGSLPYRASLTPGDHKLEVRADGRAAKTVDVRVPLEPTALEALDVKLEPMPALSTPPAAEAATLAAPAPIATTDSAPPPARAPSVLNFILGGALAAAGGAVIVIDPVRAAARDGRCADPECTRVYHFGTRSAVELAAGVALAGAGITLLIWQPLRVSAEVSGERSQLRAQFSF